MPQKTMNIDFFQLSMPTSAPEPFEALVRTVLNSSNDEGRNETLFGTPIRLQEGTTGNRIVEGEFIRIRMDQIPLKASLNGDTELFDLADDEGVGEETAFLYHNRLRILALQRNRIGATPSRFARYFEKKGDLDEPIELLPILGMNALQAITRMDTIRSLDIKLARVTRVNAIADPAMGLSSVVDLSNTLAAPTLELRFAMGHERGSIRRRSLQTLVRKWLRIPNEYGIDLKKLEIIGKADDDDGPSKVDLLNFKMTESELVDLDDVRRLPYAARSAALRSAMSRRREELLELFSQDNDDE